MHLKVLLHTSCANQFITVRTRHLFKFKIIERLIANQFIRHQANNNNNQTGEDSISSLDSDCSSTSTSQDCTKFLLFACRFLPAWRFLWNLLHGFRGFVIFPFCHSVGSFLLSANYFINTKALLKIIRKSKRTVSQGNRLPRVKAESNLVMYLKINQTCKSSNLLPVSPIDFKLLLLYLIKQNLKKDRVMMIARNSSKKREVKKN